MRMLFGTGSLSPSAPTTCYAEGAAVRWAPGPSGGTVTVSMVITKPRYTFADLLEPTDDDQFDEPLYEILGGELVVWSAPNEPHTATVMGCVRLLLEAE